MIEARNHTVSTSKPSEVASGMKAGLAALLRAHDCAQDAEASTWDFALHVSELFQNGMSMSDIRWLIAKGFTEHGQETSVYGKPHRTFRQTDGFVIDIATCFVLTPAGVNLAQTVSMQSRAALQSSPLTTSLSATTNLSTISSHTPYWDSGRRELSVAGTMIKRFRVPAQNQELILSAFQEEGWPHHIYDPLPTNRKINTHVRLHDAINRLNGCQKLPLVRFHGNGSGNGISWELRQPQSPPDRHQPIT
ncbi:MAG: hypothetical protein U0941_03130 [Planctomycetaceae bacterium]